MDNGSTLSASDVALLSGNGFGGMGDGWSGMIDELRDLMNDAPDEQTRMEFQRFISKIERMQ